MACHGSVRHTDRDWFAMILWIGSIEDFLSAAAGVGGVLCRDPDCECRGLGFECSGPLLQPLDDGRVAVHPDTMVVTFDAASGREVLVCVVDELRRRKVGTICSIVGSTVMLADAAKIGYA